MLSQETITHHKRIDDPPSAWTRLDHIRKYDDQYTLWSYNSIGTVKKIRPTLDEIAQSSKPFVTLKFPLITRPGKDLWVSPKGELYFIKGSCDPYTQVIKDGLKPVYIISFPFRR